MYFMKNHRKSVLWYYRGKSAANYCSSVEFLESSRRCMVLSRTQPSTHLCSKWWMMQFCVRALCHHCNNIKVIWHHRLLSDVCNTSYNGVILIAMTRWLVEKYISGKKHQNSKKIIGTNYLEWPKNLIILICMKHDN